MSSIRNIPLKGVRVGTNIPTKLRPALSQSENINRLRKGLTAARTSRRARTAAKVSLLAGGAAAAGAAATALRTSSAARTAAKIAIGGGALGAAGLAIGEGLKGIGAGIDQAIVKPFEDLGLVENIDTNGDGIPDKQSLTNTGKVVVFGLIGLVAVGLAAYLITAVKK